MQRVGWFSAKYVWRLLDSVISASARRTKSTLFPYTTLFRSVGPASSMSLPSGGLRRAPPAAASAARPGARPEEHTPELQSHHELVCRRLLGKKKQKTIDLEDSMDDISTYFPTRLPTLTYNLT